MVFGKVLLRILFITLNATAVLALLLTELASVVSPEKFLLPAFLSLVWAGTILINVGFVVMWAILRKWYFLISLIPLLFAISDVRTTFPLNFGKTTEMGEEGTIRFLTYNTHANDLMKKNKHTDPNRVLEYILEQNADIVCIQEFSCSSSDEHLTYKDLMEIFKDYPYKQIYFKVDQGWNKLGTATLSKFPLTNMRVVDFESNENSAIYSDVEIHGKKIRLFNCHLESNKITENDKVLARELTSEIRENLDASSLKGTTRVLKNKLGPAYKLRAKQAQKVRELINESPGKVLVAGDFNDVPVSYAYKTIRGNLLDAHDEFAMGPGWTYDQSIFKIRIDFILHSKDIELTYFKKDRVPYSDHFPQMCEFRLK